MREALLDVPIHGIAAGGAGVGRLSDGRAVFVPRTAPGDRARVALTTERSRWARARLAALAEPGPDRRSPPCPEYARCGGCALQHLEYRAQLRWKRQIVQDALSRIGGSSYEVSAVVPAPRELGYRSRVSFTLRRLRGGRVVAGLHLLEERGRVFDLSGDCLLADSALQLAWKRLRAAWGPGARHLPAGGELRLTLRKADQGVVLAIRGGKDPGDPDALLESVEDLVAIWHSTGGEPPELLAGSGDTTESWLGERFAVRASAFLQVNREVGETLHRRVLELAGNHGGTVVDAYCGAGIFGRALARSGRTAVGIEADPEAAAAARTGAPPGFSVIEGTVEAYLAEQLPAGVVILNPPRTGVDPRVSEALLADPPAALLYVSCDPATLARDMRRLEGGFAVRAVEPFDLFPQTAHVETLVLLSGGEPS